MTMKTPMPKTDTTRADLEEELLLLHQIATKGKTRRSIPTDGTLLGTLPRENSVETRYSWATVHEHPYLRIQEFQFDVRGGTWAPVKGRCFTVRVHELARVKSFIQQAIDLALAQGRAEVEDNSNADIDGYIEPLMKQDA